ncbi:MAG: AMP-binding protein [Chitinivibrionales bacterium]|nr:AMP-binding protein [Chitinivibrionales bacterium]
MNIHLYTDLLHESLLRHREKECFSLNTGQSYQSWSYADFHTWCNRATDSLKRMNLPAGFKAICIGENTPQWVIAYHAIFCAGGITVPLDPNIQIDEIEEIVNSVAPALIFCSATYIQIMLEIQKQHQCIRSVILLDTDEQHPYTTLAGLVTQTQSRTVDDAFVFAAHEDDIIVMVFTSGTTGKSKGALLMQKNFTAVGRFGVPTLKMNSHDTILALLPLYHVFGFAACIAGPLIHGMTVVFITELKSPVITKTLREKQVSVLPAVPKMLALFYENILRSIRARGMTTRLLFHLLFLLSQTLGTIGGSQFRIRLFSLVHAQFGPRLRKIISGGAPLDKRCFNALRLMGFSIMEGYGLSETFGPICLCPLQRQTRGSVGTVLPENELSILNPNLYGIGEVLLRGTCLFKGYLTLNGIDRAIDDDGWFHTGDLGKVDSRGFLSIVGRLKDIIVLESGKNVYPEELEEYYSKSELIEEIGVCGVTVQNHEIVAAVVVPTPEIRKKYPLEKAHELINYELQRLGRNRPSYKKISDAVTCFSPLPRTTTKKIKVFELRQLYYHCKSAKKGFKQLHGLTAIESKILHSHLFTQIVHCTHEHLKKSSIALTPRSNLFTDCGFDSLKFIDFIESIEQSTGVRLNEEGLSTIETLGDVYTMVMERKKTDDTALFEKSQTILERLAQAPTDVVTIQGKNRSSSFADILFNTVGFFVNLLFSIKITGIENIPTGTPAILAANHQSNIDIFLILQSLPPAIRHRTYVLGKKELTRVPLLSSLLRSFHLIAVEQEGEIIETLKIALSVLKQGYNLVVFPEGERSHDNSLFPFKPGIGLLMLESGVPVVPIRILDTYLLWKRGDLPRLLHRKKGHPHLIFGPLQTANQLLPNRVNENNRDNAFQTTVSGNALKSIIIPETTGEDIGNSLAGSIEQHLADAIRLCIAGMDSGEMMHGDHSTLHQ